jgi:hypothetical protein
VEEAAEIGERHDIGLTRHGHGDGLARCVALEGDAGRAVAFDNAHKQTSAS